MQKKISDYWVKKGFILARIVRSPPPPPSILRVLNAKKKEVDVKCDYPQIETICSRNLPFFIKMGQP